MALFSTGQGLGGLAAGGAATARLLVVVRGNTQHLSASLAAATGSLAAFNQNASALGSSLTKFLTIPLLGIGGASLKLAADFEAAMARVRGLTPLTFGEVAKAEKQILELAKELPTAPTELADSLYFAGSAGLTFGNAMQVVELSAQGAAVGMGRAADISKVLIFALNAYGKAGLDAKTAMDALTASIKEGTAEPEDMAVALGRLIPIAQASGVSFQEVVASIAALTNVGLPARVATTAMRALFVELLAPTERAKNNLDEFGISAQALRDALAAGPIVALEKLMEATGGNLDMLKAVAPQIRGFTALLALTGDQAERVNEIFLSVKNSTGALDKAMRVVSKTLAFRWGVALNNVRIAGIELGTQLMPVFEGLVKTVSRIAEGFATLPDTMKKVSAAGLIILAALGPMIRIWGALNAAGQGLFSTFGSVTTGLGLIAASAMAVTLGFSNLKAGSRDLTHILLTFVGTVAGVRLALAGLQALLGATALGYTRLGFAIGTAGAGMLGLVSAGIAAAITGFALMTSKAEATEKAIKELSKAMTSAAISGQTFRQFIKDIEDAEIREQLGEAAKQANLLGVNITQGIGRARQEIRALIRSEYAELQRLLREGTKMEGAVQLLDVEALLKLRDALKETHKDIRDRIEAAFALQAADEEVLRDVTQRWGFSAEDVKAAAGDMGLAITDLAEMTPSQMEQFAKTNDLIAQSTVEAIEAQQQAAEEERKIIEERQENLRSAALGDFFAEEADKVEHSTNELVGFMDRQARESVRFAANVQELMKRGLDPQVLQFLVDQGPAMVGKFVNASDRQLRRLEVNYRTVLGAVDAAILAEGKHEEAKGRDNVQRFAQGILAGKKLARAAAIEIVNAVTEGVASGKLSDSAVKQIQGFASRILALKGIPKKAAATLIQEVIAAVEAGEFKDAGAKDIEKFARGVAEKADLPKRRADDIASALLHALDVESGAREIARRLGFGFSHSLVGTAPNAYAAGRVVGSAARRGMEDALHGSPHLFTYTLGRELISDFDRGLASATLRGRTLKGTVVQGSSSSRHLSPTININAPIYGVDQLEEVVTGAMNRALHRREGL